MKVIILAAGKGERLWPLTRNTPKSLLEIGEGLTIIESQLQNIERCGCIKQVVLIVGYRAEQIEAKLHGYKCDLPIKTIYNPFYETSNNLVSLWLAVPEMNDDFIVLNGDDLFHHSVLQRLNDAPFDQEIVMVIDRKLQYDQEDMKVSIDDHGVLQVSKSIDCDRANGESIGMIRFTGRGVEWMRSVLLRMVRDEDGKHVFWLAAVQRLIDEGRTVHYVECTPEEWAEIDFHPDLEVIRANVEQYASVVKRWE